MKYRRALPLIAALLAVAACDFKETRNGSITLANGAAGIPINGKNGTASLVAGRAEVTFKKGSSDSSIVILVKQPGRSDVEFEAAVSKGYESGNFTLKGSQIGQPVDMTSARAYAVTGPRQSYTDWDNMGNQNCRVDVSYDPCDENWSVDFAGAGGAVGRFASATPTRCNEHRGMPYACFPNHDHEPRIPDFPRGPRGRAILNQLDETGSNVKFD